MGAQVRSLWAEPRVPEVPTQIWRDWVLIAALIAAAILENLVRADVPWRWVGIFEVGVAVVALLIRRRQPLAAVALGFGVAILVDVASIVRDIEGSVSQYSMVVLLILVYDLYRWGSGHEAVVGSVISLTAFAVGLVRDHSAVADSMIGLVLLMFPAVLGASVRFWTTSRVRELDQVRLRERQQLARELHDTVAHHVSAMVIRAQAGRVVTATNPGAAVEALEIIEAEGSRTLADMRTMVGALRDHDDVALSPRTGIADLERLARSVGDRPRVQVQIRGDVHDLSPAIDAAIYRIAQESITNALRHARHATHVDVDIDSGATDIRLTVRDDGDPAAASRATDGFGIVGMTERAVLVGGELEVAAGPDGGWTVTATLPRTGPTT